MSQRLLYRGTDIEILLGDRVTYRLFPFFRRRAGVVCYLPGQSPPHPDMVDESGLQDWAIELTDGTLVSWPYLPGAVPASRGLRLVERGETGYKGLQPTDSTD